MCHAGFLGAYHIAISVALPANNAEHFNGDLHLTLKHRNLCLTSIYFEESDLLHLV